MSSYTPFRKLYCERLFLSAMDSLLQVSMPALAITTLCLILAFVIGKKIVFAANRRSKAPPAVPGLPLIGNLHQLKAKKPHQTFSKWAEVYGPIYSIRLGSSTMVVLNSAELAKEAMVAKFSSISTRKLSNALTTLTCQKSLVAMSDYGEYHKMVKRYVLTNLLGANALKRNRGHRDTMIKNIISSLFAAIAKAPHNAVELRESFQAELFRLALKQVVINLYACNMNRKDWDEPDEWKPERFLSSKYDQLDMFKTMAFGGGKRVCAGSLQAYLIACTAIGRYVQEFQWRLKEGEQDNVDTVQLTTHKLHPMKAYITPRGLLG